MRREVERCVAILTDGQTHRTWSVLVTIFGDLAQQGTLSGQTLTGLAGGAGLRPEAVRVALHRLRKEGWIDSTRHGRQSRYGLTDWGRAQARAASPRIYGDAPAGPVFLWAGQALPERGDLVPLGPQLALGAGGDGPREILVQQVAPDALPGWMRDRVCPPDLARSGRAVTQRLTALRAALPDGLEPFDRAVLRVLIVHSWRRFALRLPPLPDAAYPTTWHSGEARAVLRALLAALPRPEVAELEEAVAA